MRQTKNDDVKLVRAIIQMFGRIFGVSNLNTKYIKVSLGSSTYYGSLGYIYIPHILSDAFTGSQDLLHVKISQICIFDSSLP